MQPVNIAQILGAYQQLGQSNMIMAQRKAQEEEERRRRNSGQLRTLGTVAGAIIGGVYGGPGGAVAGSQIGGAAGGAVSSLQGNERFNTQEVAQAGGTAYGMHQDYKDRQDQDAERARIEQDRKRQEAWTRQQNLNALKSVQQSEQYRQPQQTSMNPNEHALEQQKIDWSDFEGNLDMPAPQFQQMLYSKTGPVRTKIDGQDVMYSAQGWVPIEETKQEFFYDTEGNQYALTREEAAARVKQGTKLYLTDPTAGRVTRLTP